MPDPGHPVADRLQRRTLQRRARGALETAPIARLEHDEIKTLLRHFGLRTSLIRLKVLDALLAAHHQGKAIGVRGVHSHLEGQGIGSSFLSVREVLKRLGSDGVIELAADKHYRLSPEALGALQR